MEDGALKIISSAHRPAYHRLFRDIKRPHRYERHRGVLPDSPRRRHLHYVRGLVGKDSRILTRIPSSIGGLRATFLSDYLHTAVIFASLLAMLFAMYTSNSELGSPSRVYDLLTEAAAVVPVSGNHAGSYLTVRSSSGAAFGALAT